MKDKIEELTLDEARKGAGKWQHCRVVSTKPVGKEVEMYVQIHSNCYHALSYMRDKYLTIIFTDIEFKHLVEGKSYNPSGYQNLIYKIVDDRVVIDKVTTPFEEKVKANDIYE